jgi:NTP pyrophosphatase (non-canonical NTP hydrolase)
MRSSNIVNQKEFEVSYSEVEMKVIQWSEARKIIPNSTPRAQAMKAVEEINELVDALGKDDRVEAIDAIGDTVVCLINVCALLDVDLVNCLKAAYEQIKDRRGYMNDEGIFVKEGA